MTHLDSRLTLCRKCPAAHPTEIDRSLHSVRAIPNRATWERIEQWVQTAVAAGQRFGVADLLIAACAADSGAKVWSDDTDFARMEKLGFIELHTPG